MQMRSKMTPNFPKPFSSIIKDEISSLEGSQITNTAPGSVARSILEIPAATIEQTYKDMSDISINSFLSTATGTYLDRIGFLVGVNRRENELDQVYRSRIHESIPSHAKANIIAIRSVAEAVPGISSVNITTGTKGPGSFTILVHTTKADDASWSTLTKVFDAVSDVVAYGTEFDVVPIRFLDVNVTVTAIIKKNTLGEISANSVQTAISNYILSVQAGSILSTSAMIAYAINAIGPDNIIKMTIDSLYINGKKIAGNYIAAVDEAFTPNRFEDNPIRVYIRQ